jgi:hypothetical protein
VAVYSFAKHCGPAPAGVARVEHLSAEIAVSDAHALLMVWGAETDTRPLSVAVGRGEADGVEWLGVWDLEDSTPVWTPEK